MFFVFFMKVPPLEYALKRLRGWYSECIAIHDNDRCFADFVPIQNESICRQVLARYNDSSGARLDRVYLAM